MKQPLLRPKEDQNFWNFIFSVFFLVVIVCALFIVREVRGDFPHAVSLFDAILMTLAAFRMSRLFVYDKITRFFREWFISKREIVRDGMTYIEITPIESGMRGTMHDLLNCPWCVGMWSGLIVSFSYFVFPWAWLIIFFLALAGASSFIQITANAIGWHAENAKIDAEAKQNYQD